MLPANTPATDMTVSIRTFNAYEHLNNDEVRKEFIRDALQANFSEGEGRGARLLFLVDVLQTLLDSYETD